MKSLLYATTVTAVLTPIITIWSELNIGVKAFFTRIGTHHWVGKGITLVVAWVVLALVLQKVLKQHEVTSRQLLLPMVANVLAATAILVFFLVEA